MKKLKCILSSAVALSLSVCMVSTSIVSAGALENWSQIKTEITQVMLAPGNSISELGFAWYSLANGTPYIQIAEKGTDFKDAQTFSGTTQKAYKDLDTSMQYYSNKVTAKNLKQGKTYEYRYKIDDESWSKSYEYKCQDISDGYNFIAVGDPQIGVGTGGSEKDTERWINTLNLATETAKDSAFIYSMGDQVDGNMEYEQYAGFMTPDILRSLPIATTAGNHDCDVPNMSWHFNNPNVTKYGETSATGDYYFSYNDTLFININSNAVLKSSKSEAVIAKEHRKCIEEAISSNPYAKWRIVTFHQDIYGYPDHYNDAEVARCREQLYPIIDDYDIDVVLNGHGHNYTRSYQMEDNKYVSNDSSFNSDNVVVNDPDGTVYFELSTAASKNYENNKPGYNEHIAKSFAVNGVQSYSLVSVTNGSLSIDTYRTDTNEKYDSYTIQKTNRAKLDKSIANGEKILADDTYTEEQLTTLKQAVADGKAVTSENIEDIYNAANAIDEAINALAPVLYGDVNDDGEVAINDAIYIRKYLVGTLTLDEKQLLRADTDKDGTVSINDVTRLQQYLAKIITEF